MDSGLPLPKGLEVRASMDVRATGFLNERQPLLEFQPRGPAEEQHRRGNKFGPLNLDAPSLVPHIRCSACSYLLPCLYAHGRAPAMQLVFLCISVLSSRATAHDVFVVEWMGYRRARGCRHRRS